MANFSGRYNEQSPLAARGWKISANGSTQDNINFTFDTVLDWGELSNGVWTLGVYDNSALDVGILDSWTLDIVGKPAVNSSNFIYTNEFPSIVSINPTRAYLSDPTGINDTINTAALGSDDRIDLTGSTPSIINGANLYISTVNNFKTAIGGDGSDILICNSLSNNVFAGPGDDFIYSGRGSDTIDGGMGSDTVIFPAHFIISFNMIKLMGIILLLTPAARMARIQLKMLRLLNF